MPFTKKKDHKKEEVAAAGIAGAVIGAGIAVAAGKMLSDKKNQAKIKKTLSDVKNRAMDAYDTVKDKIEDKQKEAEKKVEEGKKEAKKTLADAKEK